MIEILLVAFAALGVVRSESRPYEGSQLAVLKVYGAGGVAGLEGYQTGVLVDPEGLVLTADSVALDGGPVSLVDAFGDRFEARLRARDAKTGLALLECSSPEVDTPAVSFERFAPPEPGTRVWVLSNAFNIAAGAEPVTVQRARVAITVPIPLASDGRPRPGTPAVGQTVILLDAVTSNPGAAGGLLVDNSGEVVGVLGAECRSPLTGAWINYAVPTESVVEAIERMRIGGSSASLGVPSDDHPWRAALWRAGVSFIPTLGERTPPYVEAVTPSSRAHAAGLRPDDLVVAVNGVTASRVESVGQALARTLPTESVRVTVLRDEQILTLTFQREAP